ncbi:MAG: hypothetical protein MK008_06535 [Bdellovibrionales bacterium]|nr:hypothetical protein [Bdellovibrionales bacterium]
MSVNYLSIFASGGGSHFKCIHQATLNNQLTAKVVLLVSNKADCGAVHYAHKNNIPVFLTTNIENDTQNLLQALDQHQVTDIILAGFIKKIPLEVVAEYKDKIINIHPSLLPKYGGKGMYGLNVHKAVLDNAEKHTGCTIHKVNEFYDEGDILAQHKVEIPNTIKTAQELSDFLKPIENEYYLNFIKNYLK